jgi:hypothetical protein
MFLYIVEGLEEGVAEFFRRVEEAVVGGRVPGVIPDLFGGIEFRGVRRKQEDLQITAVLPEPIVHFRFLVIRSVILYQEYSAVLAVETWQQHLLDKGQVGRGIEVVGLVTPDEAGIGHGDGTKNLLRVAFPPCRNFRLATLWSPGARQCRRLTERRFVLS